MTDVVVAAASPLTLDAVAAERIRQRVLHPGHTLDDPSLTHAERLIALCEEVGEVAHAMTYDEDAEDELEKELVQVAACALAWLDSFDAGRRS